MTSRDRTLSAVAARHLSHIGYASAQPELLTSTAPFDAEFHARKATSNRRLNAPYVCTDACSRLERAPLRRMGGPEDLKGIVALFASDASAYITGQTVAVDGGTTAV